MEVPFQGGNIRYKVAGQGPAIVLIHGFMENARIWRPFLERLSSKFRVIRINLPGHGKSDILAPEHSMELMADAVHAVLEQEKIPKAMLVGHSMGGYVSLAFAEKYPARLSALVMFSSSCFADTAEKQSDRDRSVAAVEAHKMKYITSVIPNLFFERSGVKASKRIYKLVKIAAKQPKEGIVAALRGMKNRPDRSDVLRNLKCPLLILAGHDDFLIPLERSEEMAKLNPKAQFVVLDDCGHVGFIEQKKASLRAIQEFAMAKIL